MSDDFSLAGEWLAVCNGDDVPAGSTRAFIVADERIVVWRDAEGVAHVWRDYCPHRGAQLSLGTVTNDQLACPYHGWRYDTLGQCVLIPSNPSLRPSKRACATAFVAGEKYGVVWMCFGEPAHALDFFPEAAIPGGRRINLAPQTVKSSAPRVVENFLDMAHFSFVHVGILGEDAHTEVPDYEVVESADGLEARQCRFWQPAGLPGQGGAMMDYVYRVKRPLVAKLTKMASGAMGALHIMLVASPVTQTETRAWLVSIHEDETSHSDEELYDFNMEILLQDTPIVESQWPKLLPLALDAELHQKCDRMSVAYRRWLAGMGFGWGTTSAWKKRERAYCATLPP
ncbi:MULTISPECIES: aromatic ring-hydroxylating dioxygenase subunit alpha [unclassified Caballeronia]|uniref:aromatic ring-hydroxylating dioxygenase subunit alpha n=1 Tax=unclassified Caballeronia TaxID=2646786 RepID=UPI00285FA0BE|nr:MULTISPECIES: aromatic ring-hydroxylating dioxygenase subunit alpha [unclassified Caballeronia]MDR5772924.1 aromatic ring-hydroxylating dioxygenase subunit alpha [Caballeronia sp. LZ002]MDR5848358.1 aromatic ring-hydroxylating dioxygenase subunit alpha [Caballeronia sp. LZ003]